MIPEALRGLLDFVAALSVIAAGVAAVWGIRAWRRELRGRRSFELAERGLTAFYRARDVVKWMRDPGSFAFESRIRSEGPGDDEVREAASYPAIYRYSQNVELFAELKILRYEFRVHFGKKSTEPFDDLHDIVSEILSAARHLPARWERERFPDARSQERHEERVSEMESLIWSEEGDEHDRRLEKAVEKMEDLCRPHLE